MSLDGVSRRIKKVAANLISVRTGTVVSNNAALNKTQVILDNDPSRTAVAAQGTLTPLPSGTRVALLAYGSSGLLVLGSLSDAGLVSNSELNVAWTPFVPTLTQSVTVGKTTTVGKYLKVGRRVDYVIYLTVTGAGTAANAVVIGLPVPAANGSGIIVGHGLIYDSSVATAYCGIAEVINTTSFELWPTAVDGPAQLLGQRGFTAGLASGDIIRVSGTYESAS